MTFWLDFLGKFHPVVLHLPIGALVFTGVLVLLALQDKAPFERAIRVGLIFSFFGALLSSMLGYLLYQSGGYEADAVLPHLILGWASTAGIGGLWYLFGRVAFRNRFVPLFVLVFLAIGFTGHYGGMLTHGEGYLTLPELEEQAVMVKRDSIQLYSQVIAKIFDKKCVSCHNFSKRKGGLALHQPEAILEGGERGLPYDLSTIAESRILAYAQLPLEDDLHMPPQGRPQLSPTELNLLTHWITTGAKFDTTLAYQSLPEPVQEAVNVFFPQRLPTADPLSAKAIKALQEKGFRVSSYIADSPFGQVKFDGEQLDRSAVNSLLDVAEQLVELDLAQTDIPSLFWEKVDAFVHLQKLRLDHTKTEDIHLEKLAVLPLQSLNLAHTLVSAQGLSTLAKHPNLERIYAWNTTVDANEENTLQEKTAIKLVFGVFEGFASPQQLKPPLMTTEKTLFETEQRVAFYDQVKGQIIRYTLDGSEPDSTSTLFDREIIIDKSLTLKARIFKEGWLPSDVFEEDFFKVNKTITDYTMETQPSNRYSGVHKLFDFEEGTTNFADGKWLGFSGNDLVFSTQLAPGESIKNVTVSCMESIGGWIIYPKRVRVMGLNQQGAYEEVGRYNYRPKNIPTENTKKSFTVPVALQNHTALKVIVENVQKLPDWHPAAGEDSWLFVDEILFW